MPAEALPMAAGLGFAGAFLAFAMFMFLIAVAIYVYGALAWMTIAKKLKYDKPWLAWIPIANMFLLPILAKKPWPWGFILLVPFVNIVFAIIWLWNIFEQRKYPGALSLIAIAAVIPFISWLGGIAMLVVIGLVAWVDR